MAPTAKPPATLTRLHRNKQGKMRSRVPSNPLNADTVFVSYSHKNERWLNRLLVHIKPLQLGNHIDVWSDRRLKPGDDWKKGIDAALAHASVAILLVSADFLASDFVSVVELPSLLQSAAKRNCKIVPVIVGPCAFRSIQNLQRFQAINPPDRPLEAMRKNQAEEILAEVASVLAEHFAKLSRPAQLQQPPRLQQTFTRDPKVDRLIGGVRLAHWAAAEEAAIQVIAQTDPSGHNGIFDALLNYQDAPDEDESLWGALHTIECCARLAPWIITHSQISRMATHQNFSVRSSAAAICMDLAHSAPDRVPLDIAIKLSVYSEDWYVQAPANAALKAMATRG